MTDSLTLQNPLARYRRSVIEAWAVYVAVKAGVFEGLRTPRTVATLAAQEGYDESALGPLVEALAACEHLQFDERGVCSLTASSSAFFLRDSQSYVGDALSFLQTSSMYQEYPRLLREGGGVGLSEEQWAYVTRGSAMYARAGINALVRAYPELGAKRPLRVLDVGCGQGTYLMELAKAWPHLDALGIDPTPRVAQDARRNLEPYATQIRVQEARLSEVHGRFDVILINQIFHMSGRREAESMLAQARARLVSGGFVFIQEIVSGGSDPSPALFGFNMRLLFEQGMVFNLGALVRMIAAAGFEDVQTTTIEGATPGLVYVGGKCGNEGSKS